MMSTHFYLVDVFLPANYEFLVPIRYQKLFKLVHIKTASNLVNKTYSRPGGLRLTKPEILLWPSMGPKYDVVGTP